MSLEDTLRVMERAPLFAEIGRDAMRLLAFSGEELVLGEGETLFQRGTPAEGAFIVLSGRMRLVAAHGKDVSERIVGAGTLIGEMALLVPTERPCNALAAETTRLIGIPRPLFRRMLEEFPEIAAILRQRLADRLRAGQTALDEIGATLRQLDH
ncbi:Crp/Fnr family transcriptional regulator [Terrihabitans sp. B22-R8]|uniref:Crp/Fnr family transcriptional regulator n=1 Tax=Terrihabitans sp. B22-R8 TaxID=3425128 RepID=UPI00403C2B2F